MSHSFVVPAYGVSRHLDSCLASLKAQSIASEIIVATSTPSDELDQLCSRYGLRPIVHGPNQGIANDWNNALKAAAGQFVTLAHQDDVYYPQYAERTLDALHSAHNPLLAFTGYDEIDDAGNALPQNRLLRIKDLLLLFGFVGRSRVADRFSKRNVLRFACPIPCPAVTLDTARMGDGYDASFQINLDWATWLRAADRDGEFVRIPEKLMGHRIHEGSETSAGIGDGRRQAEDRKILAMLWPAPVASIIAKSYAVAYGSNSGPVNK